MELVEPMINSTIAIFITVSSIIIVSYFVSKIQLGHYTSSPVKQYMIRASIGIIPVVLLASFLYVMLSLFNN